MRTGAIDLLYCFRRMEETSDATGGVAPVFPAPHSLILENRHPHHDGGALAGHPCKFSRTAKDRDSLAHAQ